jgi:radical SAM protein with 4Fe4S-binding SPASM domain
MILYGMNKRYVQLFLTLRCNQGCDFCFNRGIDNKDDLSGDGFRRLSSILKNYGFHELDLLGGEPLLHEDIIELLRIASEDFTSVYLSTNGSIIDKLERINELFPRINTGISLNEGTDEKTIRYIFSKRPIIKSVARRVRFVPEMALPFIKEGIPYYLIFRDILSAEELRDSMPFYEYLQKFNELKRSFKNVMPVYCEGFISDKYYRCPAGTAKISIMPDGSVYPCYLFFRFEEFKLGNIFKDGLEEMLNSPVLEFFKRYRENICPQKKCEFHPKCHGGCPAISYTLYGRLDRPDPRCLEITN